jgi:RNA polymerase sigma-70 factor (ECF subfamily)
VSAAPIRSGWDDGRETDLNRRAARYVVRDMAGLGNAGARNSRRTPSDEDLVRALYAEHAAPLLRYAVHLMNGDHQRAEDIVQETLLRAWQHPEAISGRPARPWLFAVARNLAIDSYRSRKVRPPEVGEAALEVLPAPDDADRALESWAVADALAALRPEHRRVLLETYYGGKSVAEAATTLGVPSGTVKSRTFYALRALRLALEERGLAP